MLTLTRRIGERIIIELEDEQQVIVELKELRRAQARIGIVAPRTCNVLREELLIEDTKTEDESC